MIKTLHRTSSNTALFAWLLLIFLAVVWGMSFILIKKITPVFSALEIGAGRVFIAALALLPWAIDSRRRYPVEKTKYFIYSGFLGFLFPALIFAFLGSRINSSLSGTLNSTTPIFTLLLGSWFFGQAIHRNQVIGIGFGFVGSLLLVLSGSGIGNLNFGNPFALLAFAATIMYGLNVNIIGKHLKGIKAVELTSYTLLVVGLISFIILLFFTQFFSKIIQSEHMLAVGYLVLLGGFNSAVAVVIFNYVVQLTTPLFGSSVTYLIPIVATLAGVLDGELISIWHYIGMSVILVGIYLINKK